MRYSVCLLTVAFWMLSSKASEPSTKPLKEIQIKALVEQLGHDEFQTREEATQKLLAGGPECIPILGSTLEGTGDGEIKKRVTGILRKKAEEDGSDETWTQLLALVRKRDSRISLQVKGFLIEGVKLQLFKIQKRGFPLESLMDGKKHTIPTTKGDIVGVVQKIEQNRLRILVKASINGQAVEFQRAVKLSDLKLEESPKASPKSGIPLKHLVASITALEKKNLKSAEEALSTVEDSEVAKRYKKRISDLRTAEKK